MLWAPGDWSVADYDNMRGEAPTIVEVGFPTKEAAQDWIRERMTELANNPHHNKFMSQLVKGQLTGDLYRPEREPDDLDAETYES